MNNLSEKNDINSISSDELREQMHENSGQINDLVELNDIIAMVLASRGLKAVNPEDGPGWDLENKLFGSLPDISSVSREFLSLKDLKSNDWIMASVTPDDLIALKDIGIKVNTVGFEENRKKGMDMFLIFSKDRKEKDVVIGLNNIKNVNLYDGGMFKTARKILRSGHGFYWDRWA